MSFLKFYRVFVVLSFSLLFVTVAALAEECRDDESYTVYFYGDSDAKVLKEQRCESTTGESKLSSIITKGVCHCYNMGPQDVLAKLNASNGPIAVTTKKVDYVARNISCQTALERCEKACQNEAKNQAKNCGQLSYAGIVTP